MTGRALPTLVTLAAAFLLPGCVSLTPFETIRQAAPADQFVDVGGQAVHVVRSGHGAPVILLHGFGASTYSWRGVIPELARDREVVAIDLNGFGWTQRPEQLSAYTLQGQANLVIGVMDALGIARADIVGHSYGGGLALWLAATRVSRVRSLVLVDSTLPTYSVERRSVFADWKPVVSVLVRTTFLRRSYVRRALERAVFDRAVVTDALVDAYLSRLRVEGAVRAYQGLTARIDDSAPTVDLGTIQQPTLLVWGLQDPLLSPLYAKEAAEKMPHASFTGIDRCGHMPMEEQPQALVAAIRPFLAQLGPMQQ